MKQLLSYVLAGALGGLVVLGGLHVNSGEKVEKGETIAKQVKHTYNVNPKTFNAAFDFSRAAEVAMPVVVHISSKAAPIAQNNSDGFMDPFQFFFGDQLPFDFPFDSPIQQGTGSGVIISEDGYIVTNNHVIDFAEDIEVTLSDDRKFKAEVIGIDERTDLAVIKIEAAGLPTLEYANSEEAKVGEWVLAVGNPFDLTSTVTAGIISAKGRDIDIIKRRDAIESFIQTDAAVNPGNSGGALVDKEGRLLGINTAIASPTGAFAGYSFAIPSDMVKKIVSNIIDYGAPRARLGINVFDLNEELAKEMNITINKGVFVERVEPGSAAQYSGILPKDIIIGIDGKSIQSSPELIEYLDKSKVGDVVSLKVNRKGKNKEISVKLKA